jgi:transcriptional regulator with XRE-family HTH domain
MNTPRAPFDTVTRHECGFVSKRTTARLSERALRLHSCERHYRLAETHTRGQARAAAVDRTPKPCLHKIAQHEHGTRACAVLDRCKCPPCAKANSAAESHRQRQIGYGRWAPYVDAQHVREHVQALNAAGIGNKRIAAVSGVSHGSLAKLIYGDKKRNLGPSKRVRWETAVRLLVVKADTATLAGGARVDALGTHRRLRALVATGWSQSKLAAKIGTEPTNFTPLMRRATVQAATARRVSQVYDELWDTPPPNEHHRDKISVSRASGYAREHGWAPPAAWDADSLDDPNAAPNIHGHDEERVRAVLAGGLIDGDEDLQLSLTRNDRLAILHHGREQGLNTNKLARATGIPASVLYNDLRVGARASRNDELDEVAMLRIMAGTLPVAENARSPERIEAIARLAASGLNDSEIGARIGISADAVLKTRRRNEIPAGVPSERTA